MLHAARNRSGPISPRSNGLTKTSSGRRASWFVVGLAHRQLQLAQIVAAFGQNVEGAELSLVVVLARMQGIEIGDALNAELLAEVTQL